MPAGFGWYAVQMRAEFLLPMRNLEAGEGVGQGMEKERRGRPRKVRNLRGFGSGLFHMMVMPGPNP
jgi:hypothetical protein